MMADKLLPKLSQNLLEMLNDEEYYDITIEVGNDPYVKIFRAHMAILHYRSLYLRKMFSTNRKKNDETLTHIKLQNISPEIFQIILRYIYGGKLLLEEYDTSDIIKVLVTANELDLQELVVYLQSFLVENKTNWMDRNFNEIYRISFEHNSFLQLQNYCTELISTEPDKILNSPNFSSVPKKLLDSIIQSENIQMKEIQVWENVLKWGLAQNPELPSDPTRFSNEDFNILKNTLQQFIQSIRFYNLTSKEFTNKVLPYEKVLPEGLYKDLLKYFLNLSDPDNKQNDKPKPRMAKTVDSKIITYQHVKLISKWIDRLEITDRLTNSYDFKLLLRGSRDGFYPLKCHILCDNKPRTVTVVKLKGGDEILGGYNPIAWKSVGGYSPTKDSFIFSFKDNDKIENCIISRVKNESNAVFNSIIYGPSFGNGDLTITNASASNKKNSYEKPIRETEGSFSIEEYEIFQII